jgi:hypothetical protein
MVLRLITIALSVFAAVISMLAVFVLAAPSSDGDAADYLGALIVSLIFLVTGAPALFLAIRDRSPKIALSLALTFFVMLIVLLAVMSSALAPLRQLS